MFEQGGLGRAPVYLTIPIASYGTAFLAAYGVTAALYVREASGTGQKVEVPVLSGALAMQAGAYLRSELVTPVGSKRNIQQGITAAYRLYQCQDEWIMVACGNQTFFNKLCIVLGREDLVAYPRFENAPWGVVKEEDRDALNSILGDILRQRPREYWLKLLDDADVPCAPVNRREEFMEDPQVLHNQMMVSVEDSEVGETKQMSIPLVLTENPSMIKGCAPRLGEHTEEVLRELGYSDEAIGMLKRRDII